MGKKKKESKEISLQGFVEESNLRKLFIGAAHYVNLASPDIQRLPLRAFTVKRKKKAKKRGALTNSYDKSCCHYNRSSQREKEMVRCH